MIELLYLIRGIRLAFYDAIEGLVGIVERKIYK